MITDRVGQHEVLLPIILNHDHYNFRENKLIPFFVKDLFIPSIERNTPRGGLPYETDEDARPLS